MINLYWLTPCGRYQRSKYFWHLVLSVPVKLLAVLLIAPQIVLAATSDELRLLRRDWHQQVTRVVSPLPMNPDGPGSWEPWQPLSGAQGWGLNAKQLATFDKNLQTLLTKLRSASVLRDAHIIRLWTVSGSLPNTFDTIDGVPKSKLPVMGHLMIGPWPASRVKRDRQGRLRSNGETGHFILHVNMIPEQPAASWMKDNEGQFFPLWRVPSPIPGTQAVDNVLLVARPGRPDPYLPVSRERVICAQIAQYNKADQILEESLRNARERLVNYLLPENAAVRQKRIDEQAAHFRKWNNMSEALALERATAREMTRQRELEEAANPPKSAPIYNQVRKRDALRAQLNAMTTEERSAPAWVSAATQWQSDLFVFLSPGDSGAVPLVKKNPAFFDKSLPRTSIQILVVDRIDLWAKSADVPPEKELQDYLAIDRANLLLLLQTDWAAVAADLP